MNAPSVLETLILSEMRAAGAACKRPLPENGHRAIARYKGSEHRPNYCVQFCVQNNIYENDSEIIPYSQIISYTIQEYYNRLFLQTCHSEK